MQPVSSLLPLDLASDDFRDRVNGCWMGKNCGGTLGAPLEIVFGAREPFDVWWYPKLEEGGIPNDDLELQLFWLKALEEVGPGLRAAHLAQYWLDHIGYNPDEYGLCKTNLKLGLLPPVAGAYNNYFKDCMGCPIRSEIWACVAPGAPRVACLYAYEDGIVDHAGGESIYGEFFNTAVESAAFVVDDRDTLIDIGLSYVPGDSRTFAALRAALDAHAAGVDWKEARRRVLAAAPHFNAQYSPINLGFQLIGWLYGEDFGDAICKAVNCGYDTDCTGATLGSIIGIMGGRSRLPAKWTQPLGEGIATSEKWGGVHHASDGANPVPATIGELTARVCRQAARVLTWHGVTPGGGTVADLYADDRIRALWTASPMRVDFPADGGALSVGVDYGDTPAIRPGDARTVRTILGNARPDAADAVCRLETPAGWTVQPPEQSVQTPANGERVLTWEITAPGPRGLEVSNRLFLQTTVKDRPAQPAVPVTLIGASRYRRTEVYPLGERTAEEAFLHPLEPEAAVGDLFSAAGRPGRWVEFAAMDNNIPLGDVFTGPGVLYVQTFVWSPVARPKCWVGAPATCPVRMWVNGEFCTQCSEYRVFRPNYGGTGFDGQPYDRVALREGWNEILLKFVRPAEFPPLKSLQWYDTLLTFDRDVDSTRFACHLILCLDHWQTALTDVGRTRFPWD